MPSLTSTLNGKAVTGWNANASGSDRIVLVIEHEEGRTTLDLHRSDAEEIHDTIRKAIEDATGNQ